MKKEIAELQRRVVALEGKIESLERLIRYLEADTATKEELRHVWWETRDSLDRVADHLNVSRFKI